MLPSPAMALIAALNHLLQSNDWARLRLAYYAGRQALVSMPPFHIGFVVTSEGSVELVTDPIPDVTITMPTDTPFRFPVSFDRLMGGAIVEGNAELATELSFVFRHLRWDATEDLSRIFGDIAAQRIMQLATGAVSWQQQATSNFFGNLNEYLAFERQILLSRAEFEIFSFDLSQLENSLSRLEQRANRFGNMPSRQHRLS